MTLTAPPAAAPPRAAHADTAGVGRGGALWLLVAGAVGLLAAATLTVEKIRLLADPGYVPSCSINPVLSCGSVMVTPQAEAFGFPNPLIGIVAFTVVGLTGVLALARVALPQWYWTALAAGTLLGTAFVQWLVFQSIYRIGALCPYCMVVWAVTVPLLAVSAAAAVRPRLGGGGVVAAIHQWRWSIVALWFIGVTLLIGVQFWDYWSTLLP